MEVRKGVKGYEGLYEVSNKGRVKSLARSIVRSDGQKKTIEEKILNQEHLQKDISKLTFV
jgi:hypothetical protein